MNLTEKEIKIIELGRDANLESLSFGNITFIIQNDIPLRAERAETFVPEKEVESEKV